MLNIINDLLDFSKMDSGRLRISEEPFDLRLIIEEICDLVDPQTRRKGIDLAYFIPHHIPGDLVSDPNRIRQILLNLVSNALKFTDKGSIVITVFLDPIANHRTRIRISVRDSGIGIPKEALPNIFEPFSQADNTTTRRYGGTGLGLAICRQLCHLMDGSIEVESTIGEGSTFSFQIPLRVADRSYPVYPFTTEVLAPILVLTNTPQKRQFLSHQLKQWPDIQVTLNDNPEKALDHLQKVSHFGMILDFGEETEAWLDRLREVPKLKKLPVLAVIGKPEHSHQSEQTLVSRHLLKLKDIYRFLTENIVHNHLPKPTRKQAAKKALSPLPKSCRILLVEDNVINQKVARKMLQKLGCEVELAENGLDACTHMRQHSYDLVFMDCMMPVMDGYEATRLMRKRERELDESHRTIVAMTANAMNFDREKCLAAGMDDYLSKPVHAREMRNMLTKWITDLQV
jgi:CheY-like chemotaxis protein